VAPPVRARLEIRDVVIVDSSLVEEAAVDVDAYNSRRSLRFLRCERRAK